MSDNINDKIVEVSQAVAELRSTNDANLQQRDVLLEEKASALNNRIDALNDQIAELTRNAVRPSVQTTENKDDFATELRNYVLTGVSTRALTTQTGGSAAAINAAGGFLVPEEFDRNLVTLAQNLSPILGDVDVKSTSTPDVKIHVDLGGTGSSWVDEHGTAGKHNETNTPTFAEVAVPFGNLFAKPLVSHIALNDAYFDLEAFIRDRIATKFGKDVAASVVTGTGTNQPKGILTHTAVATADAARAFGSIQYIASGQAAALPTNLDKYIDIITSLAPEYRAGAKWYAPRAVVGELRKVKDSTGMYMWQQSVQAGQPSLFFGYPVVEVEDMPAVAANALSVMFGDLKQAYRLYDLVGTTMLRDPYSYDAYIALKTMKRFGGTVANSEAVKVLKIAAS